MPLVYQALSRMLFFNYWVIFCYILSALYILPQVLLKNFDKRTALISALLVFGIILFRVALGRSGEDRAFYVSPPAFLLIFMFIDNALIESVFSRNIVKKISNLLFLGLLTTFAVLLFHNTFTIQKNMQKVLGNAFDPTQKFTIVKKGIQMPELRRGSNIYYSPELYRTIKNIKGFIDQNVAPDDYVYFFPHEAAYYFLFLTRREF